MKLKYFLLVELFLLIACVLVGALFYAGSRIDSVDPWSIYKCLFLSGASFSFCSLFALVVFALSSLDP